MNKDIVTISEELKDFLNDFRRADGDFDTDYLKDCVDNDSLDIDWLFFKVDRLCWLIKKEN